MGADDDFLRTLRATFAVEAEEHLQTMARGLLELEKSPPGDEASRRLVETVFRAAHSLKGAARAVDLIDIESQCESLEHTFAAWKRQALAPAPAAFDAAHRLLDVIGLAIGGGPPTAHPAGPAIDPPIATAAAQPIEPVDRITPAPVVSTEHAAAPDETVRISVAKLDAHVLDAEELLNAKLAVRQRADDVRALGARFAAWNKEWAAIEPASRALRQSAGRPAPDDRPARIADAARLAAFLEWNLDHVRSLESAVGRLAKSAAQDS
ncbi:MAG TPA: Hpt domain-containing protein, partial [Caulobacteraceae bacterium]|nr:Hpt domain-containing protein [Caulobacteraceae bacterium]